MQQISRPTSEAETAPERTTRMRQRQRLIDACISALHLYGPSRTTVGKVVALADLSPGIVRFYFDSKDAMLVASLAHLAAEFDERVLVPVSELKADPVRALERLVELYFDPQIASPRKVSVWYCFWGEASSRQEYYEICGKKDDDFAALVLELIGRLIEATPGSRLDAQAIALGLIGVLEVLWQTIAFQQEANVDRAEAQRHSMAYLRSIFPDRFAPDGKPSARAAEGLPAGAGSEPPVPRAGEAPRTAARASGALPASAYADAALLARERAELLRPAWQLIGHRAEIARPGDFLARDLAGERALVLRDATGTLHAFRNACPNRAHALVARPRGHLDGPLRCRAHGLGFAWDGRQVAGEAAGALAPLELMQHGPLIFVRGAQPAAPRSAWRWEPRLLGEVPTSLKPLAARELAVAADWKLLVELWLDAEAARKRAGRAPAPGGRARRGPARTLLPPNQLLERTDGMLEILQVIPEAPGRSRVRCFRYVAGGGRRARAPSLEQHKAQAESIQLAMTLSGENPEPPGSVAPELEALRRAIRALLAGPGAPPTQG
jgi:TetR/AcrR family transcriptional regulator, transcriptional repressor of bet genes